LLPGVGPGKSPREGTWADVVDSIPYFLLGGGPIPPLFLINEVLKTGKVDAGMSGGCEWPPSELNEDEYELLVEELLARPDKKHSRGDGSDSFSLGPYKRLPTPEWVHTKEDFMYWSIEVSQGVPALKYRELSHRRKELAVAVGRAYRAGDMALGDQLEPELTKVEDEKEKHFRSHSRLTPEAERNAPARHTPRSFSYVDGKRIRGEL